MSTVINQYLGGLGGITSITLPAAGDANPGEVVIFGDTSNELKGSHVFIDGQKNVASVNSVTFQTNATNPSGATTVWLSSTDSKLHLGADVIGPLTLGAIGSTPNANAATLAAGVLTLEPADGTNGGVVTTTSQTFAGAKTFTDDVIAQKTIQLPATVSSTVGTLVLGSGPFLHSYADTSNTFVGANSCIDNTPAPSTENTSVGNDCLASIINPAQGNTAVGSGCLSLLQTGVGNTAMGWTTMANCISGSYNGAFGDGSLSNCSTGSRNIALGYNAGTAVTTNNDTINIGNVGSTTASEINIGTTGTHTKTSIAGIASVAPGGTPEAVIINPATGQLGSQVFPGATSVGAIGAGPTANGASITAGVLTLAAATATTGGVLTNGSQSIQGNKTFINQLSTNMNVNLQHTTDTGHGGVTWGGSMAMHNYTAAVSRSNLFIGYSCGNYTNNSTNNTGIGSNALSAVSTGSNNVCLGQNAGNTLTTTSNNIMVGNTGVVTDSGAIKLGTSGTHTSAYIAGISGVTLGAPTGVVAIDSTTQQLGSLYYSSGSGLYTPTLDAGVTVVSITVRGSSATQIPISYERIGNMVTVYVQQFTLTNYTGGTPTVMAFNNLGIPTQYRPAFIVSIACPIQRGTSEVGLAQVSIGGIITLQRITGTLSTLPCGIFGDLAITYRV